VFLAWWLTMTGDYRRSGCRMEFLAGLKVERVQEVYCSLSSSPSSVTEVCQMLIVYACCTSSRSE
jgi:hypothetical protein